MSPIYLTIFSALVLLGCSQEAQPYEESNTSHLSKTEKGYIDTH